MNVKDLIPSDSILLCHRGLKSGLSLYFPDLWLPALPGGRSGTSTETLADICKAVPIPVNAIGGLNKNNIDVLAGIPIAGICVVSAIMKAESPKTATIELKAKAKELGII